MFGLRRGMVALAAGSLWWAGSCAPSVRLVDPPMELESPQLELPEILGLPAPPATIAPEPFPGPPPGPIAIPAQPYAPEAVSEIGTIEIPAIGLTHKMFQGVTLHNIDRGPSHWTGSAMPGQSGNVVVAGHRVTRTRPFRNIDSLKPGDQIIFTVAGVRTVYQVTGNQVVDPSAVWIADQTPAFTATLYACHPPGSAQYRFVVHAAIVA
ncbi:MAG: sortase [Acidimicrobiales bacterium]